MTGEVLVRHRRTGPRLNCGECGHIWAMRIPRNQLRGQRRCPKCRVRLACSDDVQCLRPRC